MCDLQVHWLKTDFGKWRDEDDSDVDESKDVAFEDVRRLNSIKSLTCNFMSGFHTYIHTYIQGVFPATCSIFHGPDILYSALIWRGVILVNLQSRNLAEF